MGSKKDAAATKRSSLNPNAAIFVPSALRAASAITNNSVIRNELCGNSGAAVTHSNDSSRTFTDQNLQDYSLLLPDDITPDFRSLDDRMSINEDGRALIDERSFTCIDQRDMEVLVTEFPGYSVECLKQAYDGNGNDLISTIVMLKELEDADSNDLFSTIARLNGLEFGMQLQDDDNTLWESMIESASGTTMDPSAGTSRSAQVSPNTFTPDRRACSGTWLQEYATLQQTHQFRPQIYLNTGETVGTGFSLDLVESAKDHSHAQNTYLEQNSIGQTDHKGGEPTYKQRNIDADQQFTFNQDRHTGHSGNGL